MGDIVKQDHFNLIEKLAWEVSKNVIDHHKMVYSKVFADYYGSKKRHKVTLQVNDVTVTLPRKGV